MIFINVLKSKFAVAFVSLLLWACGSQPATTPNGNAQNNRGLNADSTQQEQKSDSVMKIKKGAVGKIGDYSIGVRGVDASTASVAVINSTAPSERRNDYNIGFTVKSGDSIPIGKNFYRISKVAADEIEIETEPDKNAGDALQSDALAIPDGGVLELHGFAVEVVSIGDANGKSAAAVEIYSDDSPKQDLEKNKKVDRLTVSPGDQITVGDKKHRVVAVRAAKGNARAVLEVSAAPAP